MSEQYCRTDFFEKRQDGVAAHLLLYGKVGDSRQLGSDELVKDRIARLAFSWPLCMQVSLRPQVVTLDRSKTPLSVIDINVWRQYAIDAGLIRGSASSRLVHYIDCIARSKKKLRPSFAAIGGARKIAT